MTATVPPTDVATIAATAVRMDALIAALTAVCEKAEARDGRVSCRVLRRLLAEAGWEG